METLKDFYNSLNKEENKKIRNTVIFSLFIGVSLILSAIYIFSTMRKQLPVKLNQLPPVQPMIIKKQPIHKSPEQHRGYLIKRKQGYTEQSPKKKTYPTKFKISSILD
jgi:hypothetical protein